VAFLIGYPFTRKDIHLRTENFAKNVLTRILGSDMLYLPSILVRQFLRRCPVKKEEILEKSRAAKKDEGMEYAENEGRKIGLITFHLMAAILALCAAFAARSEQTPAILAVVSLSSTFWFAEEYAKYRFFKKRACQIRAIVWAICGLLALIWFIVLILR